MVVSIAPLQERNTVLLADVPSNLAERFSSSLDSASSEEYDEGCRWYLQAHDEALLLAAEHKVSVAQSAGVIARLSPSISWERNIIAANNLLSNELPDGYPNNIRVAADIRDGIYGQTYESVLQSFPVGTAKKIRAFYSNIFCPVNNDNVTLDRWMIRAMFDAELAHSLKTKLKIGVTAYSAISATLIQTAAKHNLLGSQAQAVIWTVTRNAWKQTTTTTAGI